jgi:predicted nucleic acid-binding protein
MKPLELPPSESLLIDTDVLIDYLRGNQQAIAFMQQSPLILWVSSMSVAELYAGVRDGKERDFLEQTLATYILCDIDPEIATLGGLYRRDYGKSHGVGLVSTELQINIASIKIPENLCFST